MIVSHRPIHAAAAPYAHTVCVRNRPSNYPERAPLPLSAVPWSVTLKDYDPPEANLHSPEERLSGLLDPSDPREVSRDFDSFDGTVRIEPASGRPLNPHGRTGLCGRGVLYKWGANYAVDAIVTGINPESKLLEMITIRRKSGQTAIPGGFVDAEDSSIAAALKRELREETNAALNMRRGKIILSGYSDDPRNTDNAWIETTAAHLHLSEQEARVIELKAGDDAAPGSACWSVIDSNLLKTLYASHARYVYSVLEEIYGSTLYSQLSEQAQSQIRALLF